MAKNKTKTRAALRDDRSAERVPLPLEEPLSVQGQWIGWSVWGSFALIGFCFGVWVGTGKSGAQVESVQVTPAPTQAQTPPQPSPPVEPKTTVVPAPKPPEPKKVEPKVEPMVTPEPKKPEPTPEPPPEPKKVEPEPKKPEPTPEPAAAVPSVSFAKDIIPLFRSKCFDCHGAASIKGGLDLRTIAAGIKGGDGGVGLVAGDLKKSPVWTSVEEGDMPPAGKAPLTADEKTLLKNWILGGLKP